MLMRIRALLAAAVFVLVAAAAFADDETPAPKPDYSRRALLQIVREMPEKQETMSLQDFGEILFRSRMATIHLLYAPVPPLQGSMPRTTLEWPDPLANTTLPMTPQTWSKQ